jgi:phage terminase large subunit-like protein
MIDGISQSAPTTIHKVPTVRRWRESLDWANGAVGHARTLPHFGQTL